MATDALTIANTVGDRDTLKTYDCLPELLQIRVVPDLSMNHSGFSHAVAVGLADAYLRSKEQEQRGPLARVMVDLKDSVISLARRTARAFS
jgi:hypothetical protein